MQARIGHTTGDAILHYRHWLVCDARGDEPACQAHAAALAVHAYRDLVVLQSAGERLAGELAALIGIEDLGPAIISRSHAITAF